MHGIRTISRTLAVAISLFAGIALADNIPDGTPTCSQVETQYDGNHLAYFTGLGSGGCSVAGFLINNITFSSDGGATAANLRLFFGWDGSVLSLNLQGFNCDGYSHSATNPGPCDARDGQTIHYNIGFTVDPAPILASEDMTLDPPYGSITGLQNYCQDGFITETGGCSGQFGPSTAGPFPLILDNEPVTQRIVFNQLLHIVDTQTTLTVNPNSGFDGIAFNFNTTVPEPGSWALLGTGLAALALTRRRRR